MMLISIENHQDCFLILRDGLYRFLLEIKTDVGISIPVSYTDQNGNALKCSIEYNSNNFVPAELTEEYLTARASEIKSKKDAQKILLNFILEKNKVGLDSSLPLFCEFVGA